MTDAASWLTALLTVAILGAYELVLWLKQRKQPWHIARTAHTGLREDWFASVSEQPGAEILAVQTLRNSMMSATLSSSTAALGLMGSITLVTSSVHSLLQGNDSVLHVSAQLVLELLLMVTLFASLICSAMAVRYYTLTGFIAAMPVGSPERAKWSAAAVTYLRRGGLLYGWGLRHLVLLAPMLGFITYPLAGPISAVLVVAVLWHFDHLAADE